MIDFAQFRAVTGLYNGKNNSGYDKHQNNRLSKGINHKGNPNLYTKNQYSYPSAFNPYNRPGPINFFNSDNSGSWSEFTIRTPLKMFITLSISLFIHTSCFYSFS